MENVALKQEAENLPEETTQTLAGNDPIGVGTNLFGMYSDKFKSSLGDLSKGELKRLVRALVFEGMEEPEFGNDFTANLPPLISLGKALVEAKFVMAMNAAYAAQESAATPADTTTETEGNEVNGEAHS
jgi:hypothetical protein